MEVYADKQKENFTLVMTRDELRLFRAILGRCPIEEDKKRCMYEQIIEVMK